MNSLIKHTMFVGTIFAISFFIVVMIDVIEEEKIESSKKRIIKFITDNNMEDLIKSVDNDGLRILLENKYRRICHNLCLRYTLGLEELYMVELKKIVHDIEVYKLGKKIELVF